MNKKKLEAARSRIFTPWHDYSFSSVIQSIQKYHEIISNNVQENSPIIDLSTSFTPIDMIPLDGYSLEYMLDHILSAISGSVEFSHPKSIFAASPPVTITSLVGNTIVNHLNPNLVWGSWGGDFSKMELAIITMVSNLIGYDDADSGGIFTYGGGGTILYGVKIGLEKSCRDTKSKGISKSFKILARKESHYSKFIAANWLGIGSDNIVDIPCSNNEIDISKFKLLLHELLEHGHYIACILLEAGSTYESAIDNIADVVEARNEVAERVNLDYLPHIHVDAVIGWIFSVFNDYDFVSNSLELPEELIEILVKIVKHIHSLKLVDSVGVDFHKLAYAPLTSSCFLLKNKADFRLLSGSEIDLETNSQNIEIYRPGDYSLECSRSATGVISAYVNLLSLGKDGFRILLANQMEAAIAAYKALSIIPNCLVINELFGPAIVFRFYKKITLTRDLLNEEINGNLTEAQIRQNNELTRDIYKELLNRVSENDLGMIAFISNYRMTRGDDNICALKLFIASPFTTTTIIQKTISTIAVLAKEFDQCNNITNSSM